MKKSLMFFFVTILIPIYSYSAPSGGEISPRSCGSFQDFLGRVDGELKEAVTSGCNIEGGEYYSRNGEVIRVTSPIGLLSSFVGAGVLILANSARYENLEAFAPIKQPQLGIGVTAICVGAAYFVGAAVYGEYKASSYSDVDLHFVDTKTKKEVSIFHITDVKNGKQLDALKQVLAKYGVPVTVIKPAHVDYGPLP